MFLTLRSLSTINGFTQLAVLVGGYVLMPKICSAGEQTESHEFFEQRIRPVLVEHCYRCHSAEAQAKKSLKGGLRLDTRAALRAGGESGPAIDLDKPAESLIVQALRYENGIEMPPQGRLSEAIIADFVRWIELGAPDPREGDGAVPRPSRVIDLEKERQFWSYQPLRVSAVPEVSDPEWNGSAIDRFIRNSLAGAELEPFPAADRETLVRRVYYDLVGLPPTPAQIDEFLGDASPEAYQRLVDRLLASPQFGERWGRYWLDVARFGESLTLRGFVIPDAWRYRDYVIDQFNADRPYNEFLREQVAGDLLPAADAIERRRLLTATSFLALGNTNLEEQDKRQLRMDVVDEQLSTIGTALLGQTLGCARCHDHKFDPIPTRDYYALAGILRSSKALEHDNVSKWIEVPLPPRSPEEAQQLAAHEQAMSELKSRIAQLKDAAKVAAGGAAAGGSIVAVKNVAGIVLDDSQAAVSGSWKASTYTKSYIGDGYIHDENQGKGAKTLTFTPKLPAAAKYEVRLAYVPGGGRAASVPVTIFSADGEKNVRVDMSVPPPVDGHFVSLGTYAFDDNGQHFVMISNEETSGYVVVDAVQFLRADGKPAETTVAASTPRSGENAEQLKQQIRELEEELKKLQKSKRRDAVISVVEEAAKEIGDTHIHIRGSVHQLGPLAPRGFLQALPLASSMTIDAGQSGRRELGDWLANPANPLPPRVMVNRVWHWLFGSGLVRTVDNFGTTGEKPSHPELLDYLAARFVTDGWSVKRLVREIVLSRTYRAASAPQFDELSPTDAQRCTILVERDPENRFFGRANRRRADAEYLRDAMLAAAGHLDLSVGGASFPADLSADYGFVSTDRRRSVYLPAFRNSPAELFDVFDAADSSVSTGGRSTSTSARQALYMLNHPFVREQAAALTDRLLVDASTTTEPKMLVEQLYQRTLGRFPTLNESLVAIEYLQMRPTGVETRQRWADLAQTLLASVDFRYID